MNWEPWTGCVPYSDGECCMRIETERLLLYPISNDEMENMIAQEANEDMKQAYSEMLQGCLNNPQNRVWNAVWYMELKGEAGTIVGDFAFKGLGADGMVEIGYGLRAGYCKKGYMTEAVKAVSEWAVKQNGVTCVEAETESHNVSSQNVLRNAGFILSGKYGEEGPRYMYVGN